RGAAEALAVSGNDATRGAGRRLRPKRMMRNGLLTHERADDPYAMRASAHTRKLGSGLCDHPQVEEERISSRSKPTTHAPRRTALEGDRRRGRAQAAREGAAFEILQSKLQVPFLRRGLVRRTGLVNRLRRASSARVVSVIAPAG